MWHHTGRGQDGTARYGTAQHSNGILLGTGMHLCIRALGICIAAASGPLSLGKDRRGAGGFPLWLGRACVYTCMYARIHVHMLAVYVHIYLILKSSPPESTCIAECEGGLGYLQLIDSPSEVSRPTGIQVGWLHWVWLPLGLICRQGKRGESIRRGASQVGQFTRTPAST